MINLIENLKNKRNIVIELNLNKEFKLLLNILKNNKIKYKSDKDLKYYKNIDFKKYYIFFNISNRINPTNEEYKILIGNKDYYNKKNLKINNIIKSAGIYFQILNFSIIILKEKFKNIYD